MTILTRRAILRAAAAALPAVALPSAIFGSAWAQDGLAAAKAAGQVGERPDGLLGIVEDTAPGPVRALVDQVNAERKARYAEVARATGQPLANVQAVAGERLVGATPSGQFVMNAAGRWTRK